MSGCNFSRPSSRPLFFSTHRPFPLLELIRVHEMFSKASPQSGSSEGFDEREKRMHRHPGLDWPTYRRTTTLECSTIRKNTREHQRRNNYCRGARSVIPLEKLTLLKSHLAAPHNPRPIFIFPTTFSPLLMPMSVCSGLKMSAVIFPPGRFD